MPQAMQVGQIMCKTIVRAIATAHRKIRRADITEIITHTLTKAPLHEEIHKETSPIKDIDRIKVLREVPDTPRIRDTPRIKATARIREHITEITTWDAV